MSTPLSTAREQDDPGGTSKVADTAGQARDSGQAVASSAADHAQQVASTASDKASEVVSEASDKARDLLGETRDQARTEAANRRDQAVSTLRTLHDELESMQDHGGDKGLATQLASRGSGYVRQTADWLDGREPGEVLDDVRRFARRRPGTFLLGALVAGVVAGRLTRAVKAGAPASDTPDRSAVAGTPAPSAVSAPTPDVRPIASSTGLGTTSTPLADDLGVPGTSRTDGPL
ncbi:hypothetical protein ACXR2U_14820 [Jatrophihabitans sp. YIM 134969]